MIFYITLTLPSGHTPDGSLLVVLAANVGVFGIEVCE
jgi:hypothetical protein